ncbi:MAG: GreA/GreB family elongation factor [bacterium]|nr:GreA/GreB family elongation factor [bacterium]
MSRAFVKDADEAPEQALARPESQHPNYVTPSGLRLLRDQLRQAEASGDTRRAEYSARRIESAIVIDPAQQPRDVAAFGATVSLEEPDGGRHEFTIVGEDQADPLHGTISWISPLAEALLNGRVGDRVVWKRPAGDLAITIARIGYGPE